MVQLERVKPTEPAILEMVRSHYSHRDNVEKRPRTERTGKTWWSNARLVVFSDPERTLVFAWQWPKPGIRADGQEGFNNTLFHRSDRCTYLASEVVLAAEEAVVNHWGSNRAYTYVDPVKIKSANPGYCYKMAGWTQVKVSKSGKPLLEKFLGASKNNHQEKQMNYKLVLKTYAQLRQLSDNETALLNTLRSMSESERELLAETLGPPVKAKSTKPATKHFKKCDVCGVSKKAARHRDMSLSDYHEFDEGGPAKGAVKRRGLPTTATGSDTRAPLLCDYSIDGKVCKGTANDAIHDKEMGYGNYHPFSSGVPSAVGQSSTGEQGQSSETDSEDVSVAAGG